MRDKEMQELAESLGALTQGLDRLNIVLGLYKGIFSDHECQFHADIMGQMVDAEKIMMSMSEAMVIAINELEDEISYKMDDEGLTSDLPDNVVRLSPDKTH